MKMASALTFLSLLMASTSTVQAVSPIQKVISMMSELEQKIIKEGQAAQKEYEEFSEWCEDRSKQLGFEIKTAKAEVAELKATIESETSKMTSLSAEIEELAGSIATDEADLKSATEIRSKEAEDFVAEEKDLMETINMLERGIATLERQAKAGGSAAMLQLKNAKGFKDAMNVLVQASAFNTADASRLTALVQSSEQNDDDEEQEPTEAPAAEQGGGGITEFLEGLLDKAQSQLDAARKKEAAALHNFEMLKVSLQDEIKYANHGMESAKKNLAQSGESKATAEGDLSVSSKDLAADEKTLSTLHTDCMAESSDFEAETKSRNEELKAIATAKKIVIQATSFADTQTSGKDQLSFLQVVNSNNLVNSNKVVNSKITSGADLAQFEAVRYVRDLARKQNDPALAQLASRMATAIRFGDKSGDPFAKVKKLITDMVSKLMKDGEEAASHKAYCDKELYETNSKKEDKTAIKEKLATDIDRKTADSAKLKEEVATLQKELAELTSSQMTMDKLRGQESAMYATNKAETEKGLGGVKMALKVLREYYASAENSSGGDGAAGGIISMLEVVESDFSKNLAEMTAAEESAKQEYETLTEENKITKATKEQDVKYKTKEFTGLDKAVMEANSDLAGTMTELDAIMEYLGKLNEQCIAKPEPYEERAARREAEIDGLKEALTILEGEAVLLQRKFKSQKLRGSK